MQPCIIGIVRLVHQGYLIFLGIAGVKAHPTALAIGHRAGYLRVQRDLRRVELVGGEYNPGICAAFRFRQRRCRQREQQGDHENGHDGSLDVLHNDQRSFVGLACLAKQTF